MKTFGIKHKTYGDSPWQFLVPAEKKIRCVKAMYKVWGSLFVGEEEILFSTLGFLRTKLLKWVGANLKVKAGSNKPMLGVNYNHHSWKLEASRVTPLGKKHTLGFLQRFPWLLAWTPGKKRRERVPETTKHVNFERSFTATRNITPRWPTTKATPSWVSQNANHNQ